MLTEVAHAKWALLFACWLSVSEMFPEQKGKAPMSSPEVCRLLKTYDELK